MPRSESVKQIQALLVGKWGAKISVDGLYGPATERAIYNALMDAHPKVSVDRAPPAADRANIADTAGTPAEPIPVLQNVPHHSQGAADIRNILLGMHEGADTCRKSGCLSTALWCCLSAQSGDDFPAVDSFIEHMVSCGCYTHESLLIQGKACAEFGFQYKWDIAAREAKDYLRDGIPIIIQIRKPHTHFLVGLGYDIMRGYGYHDPGTREGNFYKGAWWLPSADVTRFDVAVKKA